MLREARSPEAGAQSTSVVAKSVAQCLQSQEFKIEHRVCLNGHMSQFLPALLPSMGLLLNFRSCSSTRRRGGATEHLR